MFASGYTEFIIICIKTITAFANGIIVLSLCMGFAIKYLTHYMRICEVF